MSQTIKQNGQWVKKRLRTPQRINRTDASILQEIQSSKEISQTIQEKKEITPKIYRSNELRALMDAQDKEGLIHALEEHNLAINKRLADKRARGLRYRETKEDFRIATRTRKTIEYLKNEHTGYIKLSDRKIVGRSVQPDWKSSKIKRKFFTFGSPERREAVQEESKFNQLQNEMQEAGFTGTTHEWAKRKEALQQQQTQEYRQDLSDYYYATGQSKKGTEEQITQARERLLKKQGIYNPQSTTTSYGIEDHKNSMSRPLTETEAQYYQKYGILPWETQTDYTQTFTPIQERYYGSEPITWKQKYLSPIKQKLDEKTQYARSVLGFPTQLEQEEIPINRHTTIPILKEAYGPIMNYGQLSDQQLNALLIAINNPEQLTNDQAISIIKDKHINEALIKNNIRILDEKEQAIRKVSPEAEYFKFSDPTTYQAILDAPKAWDASGTTPKAWWDSTKDTAKQLANWQTVKEQGLYMGALGLVDYTWRKSPELFKKGFLKKFNPATWIDMGFSVPDLVRAGVNPTPTNLGIASLEALDLAENLIPYNRIGISPKNLLRLKSPITIKMPGNEWGEIHNVEGDITFKESVTTANREQHDAKVKRLWDYNIKELQVSPMPEITFTFDQVKGNKKIENVIRLREDGSYIKERTKGNKTEIYQVTKDGYGRFIEKRGNKIIKEKLFNVGKRNSDLIRRAVGTKEEWNKIIKHNDSIADHQTARVESEQTLQIAGELRKNSFFGLEGELRTRTDKEVVVGPIVDEIYMNIVKKNYEQGKKPFTTSERDQIKEIIHDRTIQWVDGVPKEKTTIPKVISAHTWVEPHIEMQLQRYAGPKATRMSKEMYWNAKSGVYKGDEKIDISGEKYLLTLVKQGKLMGYLNNELLKPGNYGNYNPYKKTIEVDPRKHRNQQELDKTIAHENVHRIVQHLLPPRIYKQWSKLNNKFPYDYQPEEILAHYLEKKHKGFKLKAKEIFKPISEKEFNKNFKHLMRDFKTKQKPEYVLEKKLTQKQSIQNLQENIIQYQNGKYNFFTQKNMNPKEEKMFNQLTRRNPNPQDIRQKFTIVEEQDNKIKPEDSYEFLKPVTYVDMPQTPSFKENTKDYNIIRDLNTNIQNGKINIKDINAELNKIRNGQKPYNKQEVNILQEQKIIQEQEIQYQQQLLLEIQQQLQINGRFNPNFNLNPNIELNINVNPNKKYKKKEKEKTRRTSPYETRQQLFIDPFYRYTGKRQHSNILSEMLRKRYGGIST